jgi:predicted nuclease with TOPRIM domain
MEKLDIILWAMGGGFAALFALMGFMWSAMNSKFDKVDDMFDRIDKRFDKIDERFERLEAKVEDIDRRLCRIEGGLASNSHCALSTHNHKKKYHG